MNWLQYIILVLGAAALVVNPRIPRGGGSVTPIYHFPVPPNLDLRAEMIFSEAVLVVLLVGLLLLFRWGTQALRWRQRFVIVAMLLIWVLLFLHPIDRYGQWHSYFQTLRNTDYWPTFFTGCILTFLTGFACVLVPMLGYDLDSHTKWRIGFAFLQLIVVLYIEAFALQVNYPDINARVDDLGSHLTFLLFAGLVIIAQLAYSYLTLYTAKIESHQSAGKEAAGTISPGM